MPVPVERAEALLKDAVLMLHGAFRVNDFPEHYIRSLALGKMREQLYELRVSLNDPLRHISPATDESPSEPLVPGEEEFYRRLVATVDSRLRAAVQVLWEVDAAFAEEYVNASARQFMAVRLHSLRTQEAPAERAALVSEVNRLRASARMGPMTWEEVIRAL